MLTDRTGSTPLRSSPLGTIDRLVHLLDTPAEPWSVQLEARVAGRLDEVRLRRSVEAALETQERLQTRMARLGEWWRHPRWQFSPGAAHDPLDRMECSTDRELASARAELQSIGEVLQWAPPLRLRLARHPDGDVLMLNLHHAAGDGFAAVSFLTSVARSYAGHPIASAASELPADAAALHAPGGPSSYRARLGELARELGEMLKPAGHIARDGGTARPGYGFHHVALSARETAAVVERRPHGVTVNDVLLAALQLAIAGWNAEHGWDVGRISVHMPVNLRPREWDQAGMGNFSFPVAIATRDSERGSPASVLAAVTRRTRHVKASGSAHALLPLLRWLLRLPPGLLGVPAAWLAAGPAVPTAVLTNLGQLQERLWIEPDVTEVWMSPPIKMPAGLAVGAVSAAGRLRLSFRYRHAQFSPEAASRFVQRYLAALRSCIAPDMDIPPHPDPVDRPDNAA